MAAEKIDIYQKVTDQIITALENGTVPWHRPWNSVEEVPRNLVSMKPYSGINVFLLALSPHSSPYWVTFKQALAKGGCVRKGEKGTMITFWKMIKNRSYDSSDPNSRKQIPLLRYYNVFNADQCDGLKGVPATPSDEPAFCHLPEHKRGDTNNTTLAQQIIDSMPEAPQIAHGRSRASYAPLTDIVSLPHRDDFDTPQHYYATAFHELVHATGHKDRLNRPELNKLARFGDESYSKEELVAEMGAAMLCGVAQIEAPVIDNQASYIANWLTKLRDDKKLLIGAGGKAQKASNFILGEAA
jgi:antirestriction protein ArdC